MADLIQFDQNQKFLMCRQCRTHLALIRTREERFQSEETEEGILHFFKNGWYFFDDALVNVSLDEHHEITNGNSDVRSFYCKTCQADLGFKLIALRHEIGVVREGKFLLNGRKTLGWLNNRVYYGDTGRPVPNDDQ